MAYAEKKAAAAVLRAARNGQSAGRRKNSPTTTERQTLEQVKIQSTPLQKYRETEGMKDYSDDAGGNGQRVAISSEVELKPKNPTRVTSVTVRNQGTSPVTITPGSTATLPVAYANLYDCTAWGKYRSEDNGVYDASGGVATAPTEVYSGEIKSTTKTMLVQAGSTQAQNFAFDGMDDID